MQGFTLVLGLGIVAIVVYDAWVTTLVHRGGGPLTGRTVAAVVGWLPRRRPELGAVALSTVVATWIVLAWLGWTLVFASAPDAVVDATTGEPQGLGGRLYFTGITLFTLGTGDVVPTGVPWRLASVATAATGLGLVTLSITYLIPVVSAVVDKRRLAGTLSSLGRTPRDIVGTGWDGDGFDPLLDHAPRLIEGLELHARRHMAYPIHWFTTTNRRTALAPAIAALDEALLLIAHGTAGTARPPRGRIEPLREVLDAYLKMLADRYLDAASTPPLPPQTAWLREAGVPEVDPERLSEAVDAASPRRRRALAYVRQQGWTWEAVTGDGSGSTDG